MEDTSYPHQGMKKRHHYKQTLKESENIINNSMSMKSMITSRQISF